MCCQGQITFGSRSFSGDLVTITLQTTGRSKATQRSYQTAIGLFIRYLDQQRGDQLPVELQNWRPFAEAAVG